MYTKTFGWVKKVTSLFIFQLKKGNKVKIYLKQVTEIRENGIQRESF